MMLHQISPAKQQVLSHWHWVQYVRHRMNYGTVEYASYQGYDVYFYCHLEKTYQYQVYQ